MYYPINETTARAAHDMMSMNDYKSNSATAGYRAQVDEAAAVLERVKPLCATDAQRDRAEYRAKLYDKLFTVLEENAPLIVNKKDA